MWQDFAVTGIVWVFIICGIPLVYKCLTGTNRITLKTSIPTSIGNYLMAGIWLTFPEPLYFSCISNLIMGFNWTLISYGSWKVGI